MPVVFAVKNKVSLFFFLNPFGGTLGNLDP
jgi:hypothetical protein